MFKKEFLLSNIKWGIIGAIVFCIPAIIFIKSADYRATWWLYLGNALFLVVIAVYMLAFNKGQRENASTQTMMIAGHSATIFGIIISCIVAFIALLIFIPDIFSSGLSEKAMDDAPAFTGTGKTHGLVFFVLMNATIGNLCGGSFSSILIPYSARKNQTKDRKSEFVNN
jgi:uncharacterized membrane protein YhaH (DUF805 family)